MDVEYFPFDEQTCVMKFGSWTYDGFQVITILLSGLLDFSHHGFDHHEKKGVRWNSDFKVEST